MHPHFPLRWGNALLCAALLAALAPAHARDLTPIDALGEAPLALQRKAAPQQALPAQVQSLSREERLGLPTFVQLRPTLAKSRAATAAQQQDPARAARDGLKGLAALYGITEQEADAAVLHHVQALPGGARLVRLTSQQGGIEVFREQATVLLDASGQPSAIGGYLGSTAPAPGFTAKAAPLGLSGAVARALQDWDFDPAVAQQLRPAAPPTQADPGPYQWWELPAGTAGVQGATLSQPARAKPVWFRLPEGLVSAYYVELRVLEDGEEHGWAYVVAASDGRLLLRHDQTAHSHQYRVWADPASGVPLPGPQGRHGTPHPTGLADGYAPPLTPASLVTPPALIADPWLDVGATQTQGNNVHAYADLTANDGFNIGDRIASVTSPGVFDHAYGHALDTRANDSQIDASVVNLFYTTNWLHDWFYGAGFDEAAGNAQASNFGRGGLDGDAMRAEALDYSGTNNANMNTPADGAAPRMQMYRYVNAAPTLADLSSPAALTGSYVTGKAAFGPQSYDVTADVAQAVSNTLCAAATTPLTGQIALVDRGGGCTFAVKVKNAQDADAVGVVVADNAPGPVAALGASGTSVDAQINIPAIRISQADGAAWRARLAEGDTLTLRLRGSTATTERSSALDNGIVAHEWGHYISNRLIGNASGLTSTHARGLGEGWGDFHALLMTVAEADSGQTGNDQYQGAYNAGAYAMEYAQGPDTNSENRALRGIRRYPYSTDLGKNPLTFQHVQTSSTLPAAPVPGSGASADNAAVHNAGEVWASMLWECYAALLNANDFTDAQDLMKRSLVAGYKLTPVNPLLTEARDALLAAMAAQSPSNARLCAAGFAKRGAGTGAQAMADRYSTTNNGVVEDFGTSGSLAIEGLELSMTAPGAQRCDADGVLDAGETGVLRITLRNQGAQSLGGQLQFSAAPAGLSLPGGLTLAVPAIAGLESIELTTPVQLTGTAAPGWGRITAVLAAGGATQTLDLLLHMDVLPQRLATDDASAHPSAMEFGSTLPAHVNAWRVQAAGAGLNPVYAGATPEAIGSHWMRTPALQVAATGDFTVSFSHRYRFEQSGSTYWDGGQLMVSTDGGTTWASVNTADYTGTINGNSGNPAQGQPAYVGESPGWPAMAAATVNLGTAYAGQSVRLAWVVHTDPAAGTEGWEVDDIAITGITSLPFPEAVADAQSCAGPASLAAASGTPQSAPVGTAFAQPLRVRLLDAHGAPLAGASIAFAAPPSGASAALAPASAVTDANGYASTTATANGTAGSYTVTASHAGGTVSFALRNTAAPVGTGGGGGPLAISGPAPGGQGTVTATVQAPPANAYFSQSVFATDEAGAGVPPLAGYRFPFGVLGFALENVGVNGSVTLRIQYPGPVPTGAQYRKYRSGTGWHAIPMAVVAADTIEITLTDGGQGDTDGHADGTITDPGGLAVPMAAPAPASAAPIPALSPFALALLAAGLGLLGWRRSRH